MKHKLYIAIVILCIPFLSSCASITTGRHQKIPITTYPSGATATCGTQTTITPGELTLLRAEGPYTVKISKEGYWEETVLLKKTMSGATAGNLLIGGIIGVGVDAATGAMFKLVPEEIDVELKPLSGSPPQTVETVQTETEEVTEESQEEETSQETQEESTESN